MLSNRNIVLFVIGIWAGMLIGISFLEAPLKFQAPNITTELGIGIGQLVFGALNKIEIIFSILIIIWAIISRNFVSILILFLLGCIVSIVVLQSLWLMPTLDTRAENIIQGITVEKSYHHFFYVIAEILKLSILSICFFKIAKTINNN